MCIRDRDGGSQIFGDWQPVGGGGSGAACVAVMTLGYVLNRLNSAKARRALIVATGALLSALTAVSYTHLDVYKRQGRH